MNQSTNATQAEPKKPLTQAVFDGQASYYKYAIIDSDGGAWVHRYEPKLFERRGLWASSGDCRFVGYGYDATGWQNSLIVRETIATLEAKLLMQSENLSCYAQSLKYSESIRSRLHSELLTLGYQNDNLQANLQAMDDMLDQAKADQALVSGLKRGIKYSAILALMIMVLVGLAQCEWQPLVEPVVQVGGAS